ncbi:MAG: NADPH-dependent oxidoreductase [Candidatus Zixiibacteriota bacterium]|nr:MAG: NADPH-dependent oxidoreductase [candidate division Zixibacteria bacterium]
MNDILAFLNSHASARRFTGDAVSDEQERTIVGTAQRSPTSSNLQAYSIISVRNQETKQELAQLCGSQQHVSDCSLFLVFCADLYRLMCLNKQRNYAFHGDTAESFIVATVDAALAACRALQAAQALGFGGVMVGGIRNQPEEVVRLLSLPKLVYPVMGMSLGRPEKAPKIKPRLPQEAVCFKEQYDRDSMPDIIEQYERAIADLGYLHGRQIEPEKYPQFSDLYSWSEHSARRMASDDPSATRLHLLDFLQSQGFVKR